MKLLKKDKKEKPITKLVITKTKNGYSAYNANDRQAGVDLFPLSDEGNKSLVQYLCDNLLNKTE